MVSFWRKITKPILCLAPMAGITDWGFRYLLERSGAEVVYSEMAHVTALKYDSKKTWELLAFSNQKAAYVVQLFGRDPDHFGLAASRVNRGVTFVDLEPYLKKDQPFIKNQIKSTDYQTKKPDGIDINFGCPAKKVFGHGSGAALMKNWRKSREIIKNVVGNTDLAVSIKVRAGAEIKDNRQQETFYDILEFLDRIKINELGVSSIMIHGRTLKQGFKGEIDYRKIRRLKKYFNAIVIANGNIKDLSGAKSTLKKTKADGIAIATGVYGNPQIFEKMQSLKIKKEPFKLSLDKLETVKLHAKLNYLTKQKRGIIEMRKHLLWYFKGLPDIKILYPEMVSVESPLDIQILLEKIKKKYFKNNL
ncbi:MAG: hypothetical protein GF347_03810 [Candidatus Moranbacteria bacterium]|nr:hypothetical protein [Candidatus Moranbacteria bacterium]